MTNTKELEKAIKRKGIKYKYIAAKLGITYYALRKKMNNVTEFTATEIDTLCVLLELSNYEKEIKPIFFVRKLI